jgi:LPXTG-motif cell wall-anchored protein
MQLSGADIKKVLENGIGNSSIGSIQYSGVKATYDLNRTFGDRITALSMDDGSTLEMEQLYNITTNDFMFTGGDNYNFSGAVGAIDTGLPIRDGIVTYLRTQLAIANNTTASSGEVINTSTTAKLPSTGSDFNTFALLAILTLSGTSLVVTKNKKKKVA